MTMSRVAVILVIGWVTSNASDSQETCAGTQQHSVTASSLAQLRSSVAGEAFRLARTGEHASTEETMAKSQDEHTVTARYDEQAGAESLIEEDEKSIVRMGENSTGTSGCDGFTEFIGELTNFWTNKASQGHTDCGDNACDCGEKVSNGVKEVMWDDLTSHEVGGCVLDYSKDKGLTSEFPDKCTVGVSCDNCKHWKVTVSAGWDFCGGINVHAVSELTAIATLVNKKRADLTEIVNKLVEKQPNLINRDIVLVNIAESVGLLGGAKRFTTTIEFEYSLHFEMGNGVGAKVNAALGYQICAKEWHCLGMEIAAEAVAKAAGKMFVCVSNEKPGKFKIEIGGGPFAAVLDLQYITGMDTGFAVTSESVNTYVVAPQCMAEPQWMSNYRQKDDHLCALIKDGGKCNSYSHCYWDKPKNRKKYCFADKFWKDAYPNDKDGLCPFLTTWEDCFKHLHCVWRALPCVEEPCKDTTRIQYDMYTQPLKELRQKDPKMAAWVLAGGGNYGWNHRQLKIMKEWCCKYPQHCLESMKENC